MEYEQRRRVHCVLCRTCANSLGRYSLERRTAPRICAAGQAPGPQLFECESYVPRPNIPRADSRWTSP